MSNYNFPIKTFLGNSSVFKGVLGRTLRRALRLFFQIPHLGALSTAEGMKGLSFFVDAHVFYRGRMLITHRRLKHPHIRVSFFKLDAEVKHGNGKKKGRVKHVQILTKRARNESSIVVKRERGRRYRPPLL